MVRALAPRKESLAERIAEVLRKGKEAVLPVACGIVVVSEREASHESYAS